MRLLDQEGHLTTRVIGGLSPLPARQAFGLPQVRQLGPAGLLPGLFTKIGSSPVVEKRGMKATDKKRFEALLSKESGQEAAA